MTETTQATYTLGEARQKLNEQECRNHGHTWDVVQTMSGPSGILCSRCGRWHRVEKLATTPLVDREVIAQELEAESREYEAQFGPDLTAAVLAHAAQLVREGRESTASPRT